jgi:hypothetical protein
VVIVVLESLLHSFASLQQLNKVIRDTDSLNDLSDRDPSDRDLVPSIVFGPFLLFCMWLYSLTIGLILTLGFNVIQSDANFDETSKRYLLSSTEDPGNKLVPDLKHSTDTIFYTQNERISILKHFAGWIDSPPNTVISSSKELLEMLQEQTNERMDRIEKMIEALQQELLAKLSSC